MIRSSASPGQASHEGSPAPVRPARNEASRALGATRQELIAGRIVHDDGIGI